MAKLANALANSAAPALPVRLRPRAPELPKNALFAALSRQQLRLILPNLKLRRFRHGRVILAEGARNPGRIFIIVSGEVAIAKEGIAPIGQARMSYQIGVLHRGDIFGEVSFVDGRPSAVTFSARTGVTVACLDLSTAIRKSRARRLRDIVATRLRRHLAAKAHENMTLRVNNLQRENEFVAYRSGVGHLVVTALCMLSFYTLALSLLPRLHGLTHANFLLTPVIVLMFGLSFVPIIATSGFPPSFFGLGLRNWRASLLFSLRASAIFLAAFLLAKWALIHCSDAFARLPLIAGSDVEVWGHRAAYSAWYAAAIAIYILLTPVQEFVIRSGIQAPLHAFLHGSETKRRWCSIVASNLVFSAAHAHISVAFALAAFLPGILWGWIFAKTNSLPAAIVSHLLVGGAAIFLFGIEGVVARLAA